MIDLDFIAIVNQFKQAFPCSTDSLDRTPLHNTNIGGAKNSWHLGIRPGGAKAIDLIFDELEDLIPAAQYAKTLGFGGIEVDFRNLHLHLDRRPMDNPWHVVYAGSKSYTLDKYLTSFPVPV